ncbi:MAG: agmatinase [Candidatus Nitrosocaldus sp.]
MSYIDLYMNRAKIALNNVATADYSKINGKTNVYMLGVPFDSTTSYRPGTRFGPDAIREALANIEFNSILHEDNRTLEDVQIVDVGNLKSTTKPEAMVDMLSKVMTELISKRVLVTVLGGEHLLTLATYRGTINGIGDSSSRSSNNIGYNKDTMLIVFDAHFDLRDEFNDCRLNHATYLRRIVEENGNDGSNVLHIGARGYSREELDYASKSRMSILPAKDIIFGSSNSISNEVKKRVADTVSSYDNLYISIDLDAIDPAFAPGVGTPEPFGLNPLHILKILESIAERDKRVVCFDVVELCPPYDNGITSVLAAKLILEIILMQIRDL